MNRQRLCWSLAAALAAVGSLAAHSLGYLSHVAEGREHLEADPNLAHTSRCWSGRWPHSP